MLSKNLIAEGMRGLTDAEFKDAAETATDGIGLGNTFSVNGKEHTLPGENREKPFVQIALSIKDASFFFEARSATQSLSMFLFRIEEPVTFSEYDKFRKLIESGNGKTVEEYDEFVLQRMKSSVVEFMCSIAGHALAVSPGQETPLRDWLAETATIDTHKTLIQNAKSSLLNLEDLPDFLTETQHEGWRLMIAELTLR